MAKLNFEKANRQSRGVSRDGAYSSVGSVGTYTRKKAVGKFSKYKDEWVVGVIDKHSLPDDGRLSVSKKDGSSTLVHLEDYVGSKKLEFCKINFYTFTHIE